jgi:hypothetical protein
MVAEEVAASGWSDDLGGQLEDVDGPGASNITGSPTIGGSDGGRGKSGGGSDGRRNGDRSGDTIKYAVTAADVQGYTMGKQSEAAAVVNGDHHPRISRGRDGGAVSVARRRQRLEAVRGREVRALEDRVGSLGRG